METVNFIQAFNGENKKIKAKEEFHSFGEIYRIYDGLRLSVVDLKIRIKNSEELEKLIKSLEEFWLGFKAHENYVRNQNDDLTNSMNIISKLREEQIEWDTIQEAIDEIKQNESEQAEQSRLSDAWAGGFADNH